MSVEIKEIKDILEEGLQKTIKDIKKDFESGDKDIESKVMKALGVAKEESEKALEEAKKALKGDYDDFVIKQQELSKKQNDGKVISFNEAFGITIKENAEAIQSKVKEGKGLILDMKSFGFENFDGYSPFATDYLSPIENKYDSFHFRNIIPFGSTSKGNLAYPKEVATTGGADAWGYNTGEDGVNESKPEITPNLETYNAKVEWIAGLIKDVPIEMLEDLPWLSTFLSNKARRELLKAEDNQILNGNGVSPQLSGILDNAVAYNGTYSLPIEMLVDAVGRQLADEYHSGNGIVLSNADKVSIILNKATDSGLYNLPTGAIGYINGVLNFNGIPVYSTPQLSQGTAIVGDWNEIMLVIRSAPRLRFFDQNEDDATKNVIMIRIEERVALPIFYDNAFVVVNFES